MPTTEERIARIEGIVEQISSFMPSIQVGQERIARIEGIVEQMHERMNRIEVEIKSNFRWNIGITITMWVTIILTILFKT